MKYTIVKNQNKLDAMIEKAIGHTKTMRDSVQNVLINILYHLMTHGNKNVIEKANTLINGLGNGVRSDHIVKYMTEFGGLQINKEKTGFDLTKWKGQEFIKGNWEKAKSTMWYDLVKVAPPFKGFDFDKEILRLISRQHKIMKDSAGMSDEDKSKIHMVVRHETIRQLLEVCGLTPDKMKPEQPAEKDVTAVTELVRTGTVH